MFAIASLFIFAALLALTWGLGTRASRSSPEWKLVWAALASLVFAMSASRVGGSDWDNYETLYDVVRQASSVGEAIKTSFLIEPAYVALNYAFGLHFESRRALVVFESAVNALAIWLLVSQTRGGPILLVWLFPLQFASILGVRQTLAASVLVIALLLSSRLLRGVAIAGAPFLHLSASFLLGAHLLRTTRLTTARLMLGIGALIALALLMQVLLVEKLDNYLNAASGLTDLGSTEVVVGKVATLGVLAVLAMAAHAGRAMPATDSRGGALLLFAVAIAASTAAYASPALIRLTTPIELVIAWYCANRIADVKKLALRTVLIGVLVMAAGLKMAKINSQFADVYEVCFFCAR